MRFIAVDVETANADMASICAVGMARFEGNSTIDEWYSLIDPHDYFDDANVQIHGIDANMIRGAPSYADIALILNQMLGSVVVVTHTHFDRVALHQAAIRWGVESPSCTWLDSASVARRTWEECARRGYGLANVCQLIGYDFQHHNALEDAKAAGQVLVAAMARTGLELEGVLRRVRQPIQPGNATSGSRIKRDGNPEGPLFGEQVVFTGALQRPRREVTEMAATAGCEVAPQVTKRSTLLVVGDIDVKRLAGHEKSSKHRKADELIAKGFPIRIIRESDFHELVAVA